MQQFLVFSRIEEEPRITRISADDFAPWRESCRPSSAAGARFRTSSPPKIAQAVLTAGLGMRFIVCMAQAIVNPEELRRFAQMLKKFNTGLVDQMTALAGQLDSLGATWRDQENHRFAEEFQRNMQMIARFVESNNEYIPFLLRKADRIDEYLQQR